ncbi:MAG: cell division ATP-binding protein FtsE [Acidobacteriota bacterium]|nr:cell division ATP-binding protein FtsE [Acidobacteriota bacterium]
MIEVQHLSKAYGPGVYALHDLSLFIDKGEFVFLTGPSGAGKSTLLRLLLCQERPSSGSLKVDGEELAVMGASETQAYRRHVGFVFQDFKLIERMTVLENTAFVPRVMGASATVQRRKAEQVLKWVGLENRLDMLPAQLSGGEQQRAAIARALINDPMMVLADEPTGNLDPDLALEIMNLFREVNASGTTVVVATHDRELIRQVGRRAIMLEHGVITEESKDVADQLPPSVEQPYRPGEQRYRAVGLGDPNPEPVVWSKPQPGLDFSDLDRLDGDAAVEDESMAPSAGSDASPIGDGLYIPESEDFPAVHVHDEPAGFESDRNTQRERTIVEAAGSNADRGRFPTVVDDDS